MARASGREVQLMICPALSSVDEGVGGSICLGLAGMEWWFSSEGWISLLISLIWEWGVV